MAKCMGCTLGGVIALRLARLRLQCMHDFIGFLTSFFVTAVHRRWCVIVCSALIYAILSMFIIYAKLSMFCFASKDSVNV